MKNTSKFISLILRHKPEILYHGTATKYEGGNEFVSVKLTPEELEKASDAVGWCDVCKGWERKSLRKVRAFQAETFVTWLSSISYIEMDQICHKLWQI